MDEPKDEETEMLRDWLRRKEYGNNEISDLEVKAWLEPTSEGAVKDLVSLHSPKVQNAPFGTWITGGLLTLFHNTIGHKVKVSLSLRGFLRLAR